MSVLVRKEGKSLDWSQMVIYISYVAYLSGFHINTHAHSNKRFKLVKCLFSSFILILSVICTTYILWTKSPSKMCITNQIKGTTNHACMLPFDRFLCWPECYKNGYCKWLFSNSNMEPRKLLQASLTLLILATSSHGGHLTSGESSVIH